MAATESTASPVRDRKALGSWYTPADLVDTVVQRTLDADWLQRRIAGSGSVRILDPACGDGRFLVAAAARARAVGAVVYVVGVDVDPDAVASTRAVLARERLAGEVHHGDALADETVRAIAGDHGFDLVIGNPPFLSQLARTTTRGGASRHGGGPYADAAVEFLSLAVDLVDPDGGRVALILPQSVLASRDAAAVRARIDHSCRHLWSWWSPRRSFDAQVLVCAIGIERRPATTGHHTDPSPRDGSPDRDPSAGGHDTPTTWAHVVADAVGVPRLPGLRTDGVLGDRAHLNANFRDEYYGLVPAVVEDPAVFAPGQRPDLGEQHAAPPLITSGLIDPAACAWGRRPVRFARRRFEAPRVDLDLLDDRMRAWAQRKLVPKVLVATQTRVIEAVADRDGSWLPGVPVTTVVPAGGATADELAAVLTSPVATVYAWWRAAGTGMSPTSLRLGPSVLAGVPWPAGDLGPAVAALAAGDVVCCGRAVAVAAGVPADHPIVTWWIERLTPGRVSAVARG